MHNLQKKYTNYDKGEQKEICFIGQPIGNIKKKKSRLIFSKMIATIKGLYWPTCRAIIDYGSII